MGRSQLEFSRRARGRGRGRGTGRTGGGGGQGGRTDASSNDAVGQPRKRRPVIVNLQPDTIFFDEDDLDGAAARYDIGPAPGDLDDRAEQLLSYASATSTAVSQFQSSTGHFNDDDDADGMFVPRTRGGGGLGEPPQPDNRAAKLKQLSQRLEETVPWKDRLRLPDFILEELLRGGKQLPEESRTGTTTVRSAAAAGAAAAVVTTSTSASPTTKATETSPGPLREVKRDGEDESGKEEDRDENVENENLDDWLDSVIQ
jgi:hypothetical protein